MYKISQRIPDYNGFKYFNRLIFEAEITLLIEAVNNLSSNDILNSINAYPDDSFNYMFSLDKVTVRNLSLEGVGAGIIISIDNSLKSYITYLGKQLKIDKSNFYDLGPKIGNGFWVNYINCASNYVRHGNEWVSVIRRKLGENKNGDFTSINYNIDELEKKVFPLDRRDSDRNFRTILDLGFELENFIAGDPRINWEICQKLFLTRIVDVIRHFENYQKSIELMIEEE